MNRDAAVEQMKKQLDVWNAQITEFEARLKKASGEAAREREAALAKMRAERDEAEEKLRKLRQASEESWRDMRDGFEAAWASISDSFRKASSRFE